MDNTNKSRSGLKKAFLLVVSLSVVLFISLLLFFFFFLRSPSFVNLVEHIISINMGKPVEIGSISLVERSGIIIRDFVIREEEGGDPLIMVPQLEIGIRLDGLLKRNIDKIRIGKPKFFLTLKKDKAPEAGLSKPSLPFTFNKVIVKDGEVFIQFEKDLSLHIHSVTLALEEGVHQKKATIRGNAFISQFNSEVSMEARFDMKRFHIDRGQIAISRMDLKTLSDNNFLPFLKDREIKGFASLDIDLVREDGFEIKFHGLFNNLKLSGDKRQPFLEDTSGEMTGLFKIARNDQIVKMNVETTINSTLLGEKGRYEGTLKGAYHVRERELTIENASLSSPFLGSLEINGRLRNVPSMDINYALHLKTTNISLSNLHRHILSPLGINLKGPEYSGIWNGTTSIDVSLTKEMHLHSEISINDLSIHSKNFGINLGKKPLTLAYDGIYNLNDDSITIKYLKAQLPRLKAWTLRGSLKKVSSGNPDIELSVEGKEIPFRDMKEFITRPVFTWLDGIEIEGHGKADLLITGKVKSPHIKGALYIKGERLKREKIELTSFDLRLPIEYGGNAFAFRESVITVQDSVLSPSNEKNGYTYRLNNLEIVIPYLEYADPLIRSGILQLKADKAIIHGIHGKESYTEEEMALRGSLKGNLDSRWLRLENLLLDTDSVKGVTGEILLTMSNPITMEAIVEYQNINLEKMWEKFLHRFPEGKGVSVKGKGAVRTVFKVTIPEETTPHVSGKANLTLTGGGFSSSDATMIGEGIVMKVSNSFELSLPLREIDFTIHTEATDFELLLGRFYGTFKDKILKFSLEGRYDRDADSLKIARSELSLTNIGSMLISGKITNLAESPHFDTEVHLLNLSNREAFNFFLRETFQESLPFLSQLEINGITSILLSVKGTVDRVNAWGDMKMMDMNILDKGADSSIKGMDISLPVNISYPEVSFPKETERFGSLKVQRFSRGALQFQDLVIYPSLWQNSIVFKEDVSLPVFGGRVTFKNLSYHDIFSPKRNLLLSMDLDGIDLATVSVAFSMPRFNGSLSGNIPKISFLGNSLLTEGEIVLKLFGGEMRVSGLSIDNVFDPITSLKSSIELKEIHLDQLTETFEFGHISGIMGGNLEDLVITNGQAESFDAFIETVKRKGIPQRISVEALKKISILGQGTSLTILDRGIYQFFKEYRYKKIGFKGFLRNDNLQLLGVESEGNKGYLVKGGILPPKVDVINYTQNISFQEMVRRLKRIKQAKKEGEE